MIRRSPLAAGTDVAPGVTVVAPLDERARDPVYIVWHGRSWCPMACKLFHQPARARREAEILRALAHPNIVRCLDLVANGPTPLMLMEFLEGPTLDRMLRSRPQRRLSLSDALRVAIHLGAALSHMHDRGYLHLDVKPSNVIVCHGRPVLFDVGIARRRADWGRRFLEGTDGYMAPEQLRRQPVSPATDLFGLGVTLHEMLTGELPLARRPDRSRAVRAPVSLRRHRPGIPAALDDLVRACLAEDPKARPTSLGALMVSLHRFIRSGPPMWPSALDSRSQIAPPAPRPAA